MKDQPCTTIFPVCLSSMSCTAFFLPVYREHREFFYDWCDIGQTSDFAAYANRGTIYYDCALTDGQKCLRSVRSDRPGEAMIEYSPVVD